MVNPFKDINWSPDRAARRSFARSLIIGFPIIGVVLAGFRWLTSSPVGALPWALGLGGLTAGLILWLVPGIARPFYVVWYAVAAAIGIVVTNLLLAAFFYLVVTPMGLVLRLSGRDAMKRRIDPTDVSYWVDVNRKRSPEDYYRQF